MTLDGRPDDWVSARVAYYPLWRAGQDGRALATREGRLGELGGQARARRPPVDLPTAAGGPEWAGAMVSVGAGLSLACRLARRRRRR